MAKSKVRQANITVEKAIEVGPLEPDVELTREEQHEMRAELVEGDAARSWQVIQEVSPRCGIQGLDDGWLIVTVGRAVVRMNPKVVEFLRATLQETA